MSDDSLIQDEIQIRSLKAELKKLIEERSKRTLDQCRLDALTKRIPEIEKALNGVNWLLNLAVANSRENDTRLTKLETSEDYAALREVVMVQADTISGLHTSIFALQDKLVELQTQRTADKKELDSFIAWAKSKGKQ